MNNGKLSIQMYKKKEKRLTFFNQQRKLILPLLTDVHIISQSKKRRGCYLYI